MNKKHIGKTLAIGIIVLFIGVGIYPAFAIEDKTSSSENENNSKAILNDWDINISFDPHYPNGNNNWYNSCVTITITYDNETVKYVYVNGEIYIEPIILCNEGVNQIVITAKDWEGNFMEPLTYYIAIDLTPPDIYCKIVPYDSYLEFKIVFSDNVSGTGSLEFYIGNTLDKEYAGPPYEGLSWICKWETLPPLSYLPLKTKIVIYDNAGHFSECHPFPKPENIYIIGFIRNRCLSKRYLGFFANYIYTSNLGIVESENLEFVMDKYFGLIGRNIIIAKIWGWQVPIYN